MSLLGSILRSVARDTVRDYLYEARHEQKMMAELAAQDASKLAKDTGISTDEAADLVEESRESTLAEGQEKVNSRQGNIVLLFVIVFFIFLSSGSGPPY